MTSAITATTTHSTETFTYLKTVAFDDGATIRVNGGLICSEHGRYICRHHKAAHAAIVANAAAQKAAVAAGTPDERLPQATEVYLAAPPPPKGSLYRDMERCRKMTTIVAATAEPPANGQIIFKQFALADGTVVNNHGRLICSEHGRRHCLHYYTAADAIYATVCRVEAGVAENLDEWPFLIHVDARLTEPETAVEAADALTPTTMPIWIVCPRKRSQPGQGRPSACGGLFIALDTI